MSLTEFIKKYKNEIDSIIRSIDPNPKLTINNQDRREWVENHESLYGWARFCGVKI